MSLIETEVVQYFDDRNSFSISKKYNHKLTHYNFAYFDYSLDHKILHEDFEFFKSNTKFTIYSCNFLETLIKYNLHTQITHLCILQKDELKFDLKFLTHFKNLRFLHIDSSNDYKINLGNVTQYLPNALEILIIHNYWFDNPLFNNPNQDENTYSEPKLKFLYIYSNYFNQSVDNLPVTLETLVIHSKKFNKSIDYLPPSLKSLVLICPNFYESIDNLPYGLEFLGINNKNFHIHNNGIENILYNLPKTLKVFISEEKNEETIAKNILPNCCFIELNFEYFTLSIFQTLINIYIMSKKITKDELLHYLDNLYVV